MEQYFDSHGLFISVVYSAPILLNCCILLLIFFFKIDFYINALLVLFSDFVVVPKLSNYEEYCPTEKEVGVE